MSRRGVMRMRVTVAAICAAVGILALVMTLLITGGASASSTRAAMPELPASQAGVQTDDSTFLPVIGNLAAIDWSKALNIRDFGAVGNCTANDTDAIRRALAAAAESNAGVVLVPPGVYRITSSIVVTDHLSLVGFGAAGEDYQWGSSVIFKDGAFDGIHLAGRNATIRDLQVDGALHKLGETCDRSRSDYLACICRPRPLLERWAIDGWANGGDGIWMTGYKSAMENVSVSNQGGSGVRIGHREAVADPGRNTDFWRVYNLKTLSNGQQGLYIHDAAQKDGKPYPNANAGILTGLATAGNHEDGLRIENASDNQLFGIAADFNEACGIHLLGPAAGNSLWMPYSECNNQAKRIPDSTKCEEVTERCEIQFEAGTQFNVAFGTRAGQEQDTYDEDLGWRNLILGRRSEAQNWHTYGNLELDRLLVNDSAESCDGNSVAGGLWQFQQDPRDQSLKIGSWLGPDPITVTLFRGGWEWNAATGCSRAVPSPTPDTVGDGATAQAAVATPAADAIYQGSVRLVVKGSIEAEGDAPAGVSGQSAAGKGVSGSSTSHIGVFAESSGSWRANPALQAQNLNPDRGQAAVFLNGSQFATAHVENTGSGEVLFLKANGGAFLRAVAHDNEADRKYDLLYDGKAYADDSWHAGGTAFAEMLPGAGGLGAGDVLVIGADGTLVCASEPGQTHVAGVYAAQAGFVGGDPPDGKTPGVVPLAVAGVVEVKVSAENGAIQSGALLVTSETPCHAMRSGTNPPQGSVIGKALGRLDSGRGTIKMLVSLQ